MPAVSKKQERFMQAVAHNPAFAKKVDVPQSVGREFTKGSNMKAKKYMDGGRATLPPQASARAAQALAARPAMPGSAVGTRPFKKGGSVAASKMGAVKTAAPSRDGVATKGKTKGTIVKMAKGGKACK